MTDSDHRTYKKTRSWMLHDSAHAVLQRGKCSCSFLQELPLLYNLFGTEFFLCHLENPVPIKSTVQRVRGSTETQSHVEELLIL